jgi:nitroimidazol reductase NimA-like FMN-containing flavoprotein (pyridoxamine 5'-phosphate oxidase superfamily)
MTMSEPVGKLDARFSAHGATAIDWREARDRLKRAQLYWLTTVRPDGRPHVTPLISVWLDGASHFCTGATEQKAKNLEQNRHVVLTTTGQNALDEGLDVVVEGDALQVIDDGELRRLAEAYESKYGSDWHFDVRDGAFHSDDASPVPVFRIAPSKVFGFSRGALGSQTCWRF